MQTEKEKLIIDTDIGSDVDDVYAVLLALASPEIDLKLVTLVHANLEVRAKVAAKLLKLSGREDVPIYKGSSQTLRCNRPTYWGGFEGEGIDFSDTGDIAVGEEAVSAIIETVRRFPGEITICPIGALTNIAAAIERDPLAMKQVKSLSIMGSSFRGTGYECAEREHNIFCDPEAAQTVLGFGVPVRLVGLNVTRQVMLKKADIDPLRGHSPLADYVVHMTDQWFGVRKSDETAMHDPLAVAAVVKPDIVTTERFSAHVVTEGPDAGKIVFKSPEEGKHAVDVCTGVDVRAFGELFLARVHNYIKERN